MYEVLTVPMFIRPVLLKVFAATFTNLNINIRCLIYFSVVK